MDTEVVVASNHEYIFIPLAVNVLLLFSVSFNRGSKKYFQKRQNISVWKCLGRVTKLWLLLLSGKKNLLEQHSKLTRAKLVSTSLKRKYYCRVKFLKADSNFSRKGEVLIPHMIASSQRKIHQQIFSLFVRIMTFTNSLLFSMCLKTGRVFIDWI